MQKRILRGAFPMVVTTAVTILAAACALPLAHADIYTWTDEYGRVNISNLAPPEGARVTKVALETAGTPVARDKAREALREAEVRLLAERVRQLQNEVEVAKRPAPPPVEYRAVQPAPVAPAIIQYITLEAPQYPAPAPQPASYGCNSGWPDCTFGWYPGFYPYPVNVFVPRHPPGQDRPDRPDRPGPPAQLPRPHIAPWLPIVGPGGRGF